MGMNEPIPLELLAKMHVSRSCLAANAPPARPEPEPVNPARDKAMKREEGKLQSEINSYLRLHGLEYICPPMHKRSMLPSGWPDHTTAYRGIAIGIESKAFGEKPDPHQSKRHEAMMKAGWRVIVAYSVADVQALFRSIDMELGRPSPD